MTLCCQVGISVVLGDTLYICRFAGFKMGAMFSFETLVQPVRLHVVITGIPQYGQVECLGSALTLRTIGFRQSPFRYVHRV